MKKSLSQSIVCKALQDCLPQKNNTHSLAVGVIALGFALSVASPVQADTFTVTNINDSGSGSLRQVIQNANANPGADTVVFSTSVTGAITLTSGQLDITDAVILLGQVAISLL